MKSSRSFAQSVLKAATIVALSLSLSACADMKTAKLAVKEGDYATALENYEKLAEIGLPDAQLELAKLYRDGNGVKQDEKKAAELMQKAADAGNAKAMTELGRLYADGRGVPASGKKASDSFKQAAAMGDVRADYYRAQLYRDGKIVNQDAGFAQELFLKAVLADMKRRSRSSTTISCQVPVCDGCGEK